MKDFLNTVNARYSLVVAAPAMDELTRGYLETALWSSHDNADDSGGEPLDKNYDLDDFDEQSIKRAIKDCAAFEKKAGSLLDGEKMSTVGHDFWLTRNGHGAGFWDGDYEEEKGKKLSAISKSFGEIDIEVGDDGKLHFFGGK